MQLEHLVSSSVGCCKMTWYLASGRGGAVHMIYVVVCYLITQLSKVSASFSMNISDSSVNPLPFTVISVPWVEMGSVGNTSEIERFMLAWKAPITPKLSKWTWNS